MSQSRIIPVPPNVFSPKRCREPKMVEKHCSKIKKKEETLCFTNLPLDNVREMAFSLSFANIFLGVWIQNNRYILQECVEWRGGEVERIWSSCKNRIGSQCYTQVSLFICNRYTSQKVISIGQGWPFRKRPILRKTTYNRDRVQI